MTMEVGGGRMAALEEYATGAIAFRVDHVLDVTAGGGVGFSLWQWQSRRQSRQPPLLVFDQGGRSGPPRKAHRKSFGRWLWPGCHVGSLSSAPNPKGLSIAPHPSTNRHSSRPSS